MLLRRRPPPCPRIPCSRLHAVVASPRQTEQIAHALVRKDPHACWTIYQQSPPQILDKHQRVQMLDVLSLLPPHQAWAHSHTLFRDSASPADNHHLLQHLVDCFIDKAPAMDDPQLCIAAMHDSLKILHQLDPPPELTLRHIAAVLKMPHINFTNEQKNTVVSTLVPLVISIAPHSRIPQKVVRALFSRMRRIELLPLGMQLFNSLLEHGHDNWTSPQIVSFLVMASVAGYDIPPGIIPEREALDTNEEINMGLQKSRVWLDEIINSQPTTTHIAFVRRIVHSYVTSFRPGHLFDVEMLEKLLHAFIHVKSVALKLPRDALYPRAITSRAIFSPLRQLVAAFFRHVETLSHDLQVTHGLYQIQMRAFEIICQLGDAKLARIIYQIIRQKGWRWRPAEDQALFKFMFHQAGVQLKEQIRDSLDVKLFEDKQTPTPQMIRQQSFRTHTFAFNLYSDWRADGGKPLEAVAPVLLAVAAETGDASRVIKLLKDYLSHQVTVNAWAVTCMFGGFANSNAISGAMLVLDFLSTPNTFTLQNLDPLDRQMQRGTLPEKAQALIMDMLSRSEDQLRGRKETNWIIKTFKLSSHPHKDLTHSIVRFLFNAQPGRQKYKQMYTAYSYITKCPKVAAKTVELFLDRLAHNPAFLIIFTPHHINYLLTLAHVDSRSIAHFIGALEAMGMDLEAREVALNWASGIGFKHKLDVPVDEQRFKMALSVLCHRNKLRLEQTVDLSWHFNDDEGLGRAEDWYDETEQSDDGNEHMQTNWDADEWYAEQPTGNKVD